MIFFLFPYALDIHSYKVLLCVLSSPLKAALLNSFPDIFDELLQMFTVQEVAEYVRGTLGSMPSTVDIGQSMDVVKLQSIARTVESRLFYFPGEAIMKVLGHVSMKILKQRGQIQFCIISVTICKGNVHTVHFSVILTLCLHFLRYLSLLRVP